MKTAEILRKFADILDAQEPQAPVQQPIVINVNGGQAEQQSEPEELEPAETDVMIPPLQQKIELLKKNAGLENAYDQQADEDEPLDQ